MPEKNQKLCDICNDKEWEATCDKCEIFVCFKCCKRCLCNDELDICDKCKFCDICKTRSKETHPFFN